MFYIFHTILFSYIYIYIIVYTIYVYVTWCVRKLYWLWKITILFLLTNGYDKKTLLKDFFVRRQPRACNNCTVNRDVIWSIHIFPYTLIVIFLPASRLSISFFSSHSCYYRFFCLFLRVALLWRQHFWRFFSNGVYGDVWKLFAQQQRLHFWTRHETLGSRIQFYASRVAATRNGTYDNAIVFVNGSHYDEPSRRFEVSLNCVQ